MLKSKKLLKIVAILTLSLSLGIIGYLALLGSVWSQFDYQVLDYFYRQAVAAGDGVKNSEQVAYLTITDDTYRYFGKNTLDRAGLARVNDVLDGLGVAAVAYDLIFARPAKPESDSLFAESLDNLASVYLPIGFGISREKTNFHWQEDLAYKRLQDEYLSTPIEINRGLPYFAKRASMQNDTFLQQAAGSGHISALSDEDGVYRHICILIKVDSLYLPTLTLSMFLDYFEVPFDSVIVEWGRQVRIPALRKSYLEQDVVIPISESGTTFIPFVDTWGNDFQQMTVHTLLERMENAELQGTLEQFFEGNFVFIGEASIGIADLGHTPLENDAPLVAIHASMMNAFLKNQFYSEWHLWPTIGIIAGIAIVFGVAASFKRNSILYVAGILFFAGIIYLSWYEITHLSLFPIITVGRSGSVIFVGLVIGLQVAISKDQQFIRNAFSKYVPEGVVNELLTHPEQLQLGGEERELSVLFSDLVGFTSISEKIPPRKLVRLLNDYFSEMTKIILEEGGIIDKYLGDAIMAEFGAPLELLDHPVRAVHAALKMQQRLAELEDDWARIRLPALQCRVGINTGQMVVGNMGSHQTFDYTVIGDAVNLASRLESANKFYGTSLMISEATYRQLAAGVFRTRLLDVIKVKGKSRTIPVYEVYGLQSDPIARIESKYYQAYSKGFEAYFERDFEFARQLFSESLRYRPQDLAANALIHRIDAITPEMLESGWDGSVALSEK